MRRGVLANMIQSVRGNAGNPRGHMASVTSSGSLQHVADPKLPSIQEPVRPALITTLAAARTHDQGFKYTLGPQCQGDLEVWHATILRVGIGTSILFERFVISIVM